MKHQHSLPGHSLKMVAAAVMLALGSSAPALAQQQQDPQAQGEWPQQEQQRGTTERDGQQERDNASAADARSDSRDYTAATNAERGDGSLDELAEQHDGLGKFVDAVKTAGMEDSLMRGTYTVFAPTDEAIEEAGGDELLDGENIEEMKELLRAHIVADDVDREMAGRISQAMTLDGGVVELEERDGKLTVDGANIEDADIQLAGLRVFAIDKVLSVSDDAQRSQDRDDDDEDESRASNM